MTNICILFLKAFDVPLFVHSFTQTSTKCLLLARCGNLGKVLENSEIRYFLSFRMMSTLKNNDRGNISTSSKSIIHVSWGIKIKVKFSSAIQPCI